jgi:Uma2 family endonuclease
MTVVQIATDMRRIITEEEFLNWPRDGRRWELVDGEAKEVPAGHEHDAIGMQVAVLLKPFVRGQGVVAGAQAGFRMRTGNIRSLDVAFTLKERLPDGKPSKGFENLAPDLAVEILSPSDDVADLPRKVNEYFTSGTQQVWLLEPET